MPAVCFVCLGNICRSPTAEGVMLHLLEQRGLRDEIRVESAGTANYHVGEPPDDRSIQAALRRGVRLPSMAHHFRLEDFDRFDHVVCMDRANFKTLLDLSRGRHDVKVSLLLDFDPNCPKGSRVPDPYYGGEEGFEHVLDLCFAACGHLLDHLVESYGLVARAK